MNDGQQDDLGLLESKLFDVNKKIERLEERFIEEELTVELYNKYGSKYQEEKKEIEDVLWKSSKGASNLPQSINLALDFISKMAFKWRRADYFTKQKIKFLLFPSGIG